MIPEYLQRVLDSFDYYEEVSDGFVCLCPVAGHGEDGEDSTPSVHVSVGEEGRVLVTCRVGCPRGAVLSAVGLSDRDLFCPRGEEPAETLAHAPGVMLCEDVELRDRVYATLVGELGLEERHEKGLLARGLSGEDISANGYRSFSSSSQRTVAHNLHKFFGDDLYRVPGFFEGPYGPDICGRLNGLLVPVVDLEGRVVSVKVRRDGAPSQLGGSKYIPFSTPGVSSSGVPAHHSRGWDEWVAYGPYKSEPLVVRVTEGELKADVSYSRTRVLTVGVPGVAHWRQALPTLERLRPRKVLLAWDWPDVKSKRGVCETLLAFAEHLRSQDVPFAVEFWDSGHKGIDDLLAEDLWPHEMAELPALDWLRTRMNEFNELGAPSRNGEIEGGYRADEKEPSPPAKGEVPAPAALPPRGPDPDPRVPFPVEVFPPAVRRFVEQQARALPCPVDFMGVSCLVVASSAVGTSRRLKNKESYKEFGNLYAAIIGAPGTLKSPAIAAAMAPVQKVDRELERRYQAAKEFWKEDWKKYKVARSAYDTTCRKLLREAMEAGTRPEDVTLPACPPEPDPLPPEESWWVHDKTLESMMRMFLNSYRGLIDCHDELIGLFNDLNKYRGGKGSDRQAYLSCWQCSSRKVNRVSGDPMYLQDPYLCILGGIQPGLIHDMRDERGREDGFFSRFLMCWPECDPGPGLDFRADVDPAVAAGWERVVRTLRAFPWAEEAVVVGHREEGGVRVPITRYNRVPKVLTLSPGAEAVFTAWHEPHRGEINDPDFPRVLEGTWSKLKAYCFRLALVVHMLRRAEGDNLDPDVVDGESMGRAVRLVEYFKGQVRYVSSQMGDDATDRDIREFCEWCRSKWKGKVSFREIMRKGSWQIKSKSDALRFCRKLCDRELGSIQQFPGKNNQMADHFVLKPPREAGERGE